MGRTPVIKVLAMAPVCLPAFKVSKNVLNKLDQSNTLKELRNFKNVIKEDFNKIDVDKSRNPLKVMLAGEIHISLEPYVNLDIRRKLGEMGIEIHQSLSLYDWVVHKFHLNYHRKWLEHLSHPYVPMEIGGECVWVLGEYIDKAKAGFDGFVHSYPFTCMPEIVAQNIMPSTKENIPVLTILCDEQMAKPGMLTRLEAFVDLLERKQRAQNNNRQ